MPSPNTAEQDYFRRGEVYPDITSKLDPREVDYFRRLEVYDGSLLSPEAVAASTDVGTSASLNNTGVSDITTNAILTTTAGYSISTSLVNQAIGTTDVTTTADITGTGQSDVTTNANISIVRTKDVTTDLATQSIASTSVTSDAIIETVVLDSISTTASISLTETHDLTTTASVSFIATSDVITDADISIVLIGTQDVTTDASIYKTSIPIYPPICTTVVRSWVQLYDTGGTMVALFDDWKTLELSHVLNGLDTLVLTMDDLDPRIPLFGLDFLVEVWREVGTYRYREYVGFHRVSQHELTSDQHAIFTSKSVGLNDLLHRRIVGYQGIIAQTLKQAPGETVIKEIVHENVGPGAVSPPRFTDGTTPNFTLESDQGRGPVWTSQLTNDNILDVIANIANLSGVDFQVVRVGTTPIAFEFRVGYPQLGVDRSAYLAFAPDLGTMISAVYSEGADAEVNVAIALGTGSEGSRHIAPFYGPDLTASPWNKIEGTVDASNQDSYMGMQSLAEASLLVTAPQETFSFEVVQSDIAMYGRDYSVGDVVSARFRDIVRVKKIIGSTLSISQGVETIQLTFADLP